MNRANLRKPFFLLSIAILAFFFIDREVALFLSPKGHQYTPLLKGCTLLIFPPLYLALSLGGFLIARLKKSAWAFPLFGIFVAQALSVACVRTLKVIIGRSRPDIFLKKGVYALHPFSGDTHFHSFPSGHSIAAFTLATSLAYLFPRYRLYFFGGAALLTCSRVLLLGHYCSDVIASAALALLIGNAVHTNLEPLRSAPS